MALCSIIVFCGEQRATAAPLPDNGGYIKIGIGYSPYSRTALDLSESSIISNGLAPSVAVGVVWARSHSLDIRWQNIYLNDPDGKSQGYWAVTYTRYLKNRGPAPFFDIGFGMQHGPLAPGSSDVRDFETNDGLGFTVGAGIRLSRKFEMAADFAVGSSGRFFSANNNFDYSHQQLAFSLRYTIVGG